MASDEGFTYMNIESTIYDSILHHTLEKLVLNPEHYASMVEMEHCLGMIQRYYSKPTYEHWVKIYHTAIQK